MIKNTFISFHFKKKKKARDLLNFMYSVSLIRYEDLLHIWNSHLELHRKDYLSQRGLRKILGKCQRLLAYLSKKKIEYVIKN